MAKVTKEAKESKESKADKEPKTVKEAMPTKAKEAAAPEAPKEQAKAKEPAKTKEAKPEAAPKEPAKTKGPAEQKTSKQPKKEKQPEEEYLHIVRVAGTDLDGRKKIEYGLTKIRGIGLRMGGAICSIAKVDRNKKVGYMTDGEAQSLGNAIEALKEKAVPAWMYNRKNDYDSGENLHITGSDLIMSLRDDLNRLRKIRSYRGIRHERGLPVRGQKTRTGFRGGTTVGVSRKKIRAQQTEKK